jgi:hypothetical protein
VVGCGVGPWAAAYFLFGLFDEKVLLSRYFNPTLAMLILLLLVSLELERSVRGARLATRPIRNLAPCSVRVWRVFDGATNASKGRLAGCQSALALGSHQRRSAACTRAAAYASFAA